MSSYFKNNYTGRNTLTTWYVDGRPMPPPKTMRWSLQDLQAPGSGRLLDGKMHAEFVAEKRKIEITYNNSDTAIFNEALRAVSGGGYRQVTYWDLADWGWRTSTMYVSDRIGVINHFLPDRIITGELSFSLVEV